MNICSFFKPYAKYSKLNYFNLFIAERRNISVPTPWSCCEDKVSFREVFKNRSQ